MIAVGYDVNRIQRVWAEHSNQDVAETMCKEEAQKYVRRRPDTGPMSQWFIALEDE